jgi:hypothetical protein
VEEIARYKWLESERLGYDIGWERARKEWERLHFPAWKRFHWENALKEARRINLAPSDRRRIVPNGRPRLNGWS